MSKLAFQAEVSLSTVTCGGCGITYAIPEPLHRQYLDNGATINCPNSACPWGGMVRKETEVMRLKKDLEEKERQRASEAQARRWAEASLTATKGQLTKLRKRVANGVCPCCKRTFQNLARHMKTQHPEGVA